MTTAPERVRLLATNKMPQLSCKTVTSDLTEPIQRACMLMPLIEEFRELGREGEEWQSSIVAWRADRRTLGLVSIGTLHLCRDGIIMDGRKESICTCCTLMSETIALKADRK